MLENGIRLKRKGSVEYMGTRRMCDAVAGQGGRDTVGGGVRKWS